MRPVIAAVVACAVCAAAPTAHAAVKARGSVEQVQVTGAKRGAKLALVNRKGKVVARQRAGRLGAAVFRSVKPGKGYRLRAGKRRSARFTVQRDRSAPPSKKLYRQKLPKQGYGYLTTRDGTKLAIAVRTPGGPGPFPTLIEYAGYGFADPAGAHSGISPIANLLGFAVVDVNMRGTGCSGGAFDYFEPLQNLDGYDIVETVARQPWVAHHKVGMVGVSYGGISQLFVAKTRPPSLAAITPLSVIDDTITTLYPGGILNTGFTLEWAKDRVHDAQPASKTGGQPWALERIRGGDKTCKANQALHAEAPSVLKKIRRNTYYRPSVADPLSPSKFVHKIDVPVFLACQLTDEQTGAHCPALTSRFTGTRKKWFTYTNGVHTDSLDPETFNRWYDFLSIYVAQKPPTLSPDVRTRVAPAVFQGVLGVPDVTLPDDPIQGQPTLDAARAAFEAQPSVRMLFDNGAGRSPGAPYPGFEQSFGSFPAASARAWFLGAGGTLTDAAPADATAGDAFTWNPKARPADDFDGPGNGSPGGLWTATPPYNWTQNPQGTAVSYVTDPLADNTTVIGAGSLEAWIRTTAPSVDLQATITEVRPDGQETYVQSGYLRTRLRKLAKGSTPLVPKLSLRKRDASALPKGRFAKVTVPLFYQGHVYRAGSRVRVTLSAAGGDQPVWAFSELEPKQPVDVAVARSASMPSRLVLPSVAGVGVPTGLPPCPSLRGEPCRPYQPTPNRAG
jgi:predicted acyl esterase